MAIKSQGGWRAGIYPDGTAFVVLKDLNDEGRQIEVRSKDIEGGMGFYLWKNPQTGIGMGNIPFDALFDMLVEFVKSTAYTSDEVMKERLRVFDETP